MHQSTIFSVKSKKPYFWSVFGHYHQNEIFSQKSCSLSFLHLRHANFMRSFRKILQAVLEKTCLLTDIPTYWQLWNHRTPSCLKAGVQKLMINEILFFSISPNFLMLHWTSSTDKLFHYFLNNFNLSFCFIIHVFVNIVLFPSV